MKIGGGAPISVQSMTTGKTHDVDGCLAEIRGLAEAGADVVRVAVPRPEDADALGAIVKGSPVPIVADIHFNYQYALQALGGGRGEGADQPGQHREARVGARGAPRGEGPGRPDPDRRELRVARKGHPRQVGLPAARGPLRERDAARRGLRARGVRGRRDLGQALRRLLHDPELPAARRRDRLPAPPRRDRVGQPQDRPDQVVDRHRLAPRRRHRRHDPRLARGRLRERGARRPPDPEVAPARPPRRQRHRVPDVRAPRRRPLLRGRRGRGGGRQAGVREGPQRGASWGAP